VQRRAGAHVAGVGGEPGVVWLLRDAQAAAAGVVWRIPEGPPARISGCVAPVTAVEQARLLEKNAHPGLLSLSVVRRLDVNEALCSASSFHALKMDGHNTHWLFFKSGMLLLRRSCGCARCYRQVASPLLLDSDGMAEYSLNGARILYCNHPGKEARPVCLRAAAGCWLPNPGQLRLVCVKSGRHPARGELVQRACGTCVGGLPYSLARAASNAHYSMHAAMRWRRPPACRDPLFHGHHQLHAVVCSKAALAVRAPAPGQSCATPRARQ
jgi:hypothetical protein